MVAQKGARIPNIMTRFRDFSNMQHRHIACLIKNGEQMIICMKTKQIL